MSEAPFNPLPGSAAEGVPALHGLELSQLRVLDALYELRSVSAAASRLCLTPSAVSHALRKLRAVLGDDLFCRSASGMQPTARTHEIAPELREALSLLGRALDVGTFVPAASHRRFRIACLLSMRMLLAPRVIQAMERAAPGVRVEFRQIDDGFVEDLDRGRIDLGIATIGQPLGWMRSAPLLQEDMVFAIRRGHLRGSAALTLGELATLRHVDIRTTDFIPRRGGPAGRDGSAWSVETMEHTAMQAALAELGLDLHVGVVVPDSLSALEIIARTDMITLCPRRIAERFGDEILLLEAPYALQPSPIQIIWSARHGRDQGLIWMRDIVLDAADASFAIER